MRPQLRKTTFIALLSAFSLISYFIESMLPPLIPAVAGARLGLSNIFVLYALYAFGWGPAAFVAIIKSLLGPVFAGSPTGIFFALAGSLLSLPVMSVLKNTTGNRFGVVGISVAGSLFHNAGQIAMAMIFTSELGVAYQFPLLALISVPCGIIIGVAADRLLKITENISLKHNKTKTRRKTQ